MFEQIIIFLKMSHCIYYIFLNFFLFFGVIIQNICKYLENQTGQLRMYKIYILIYRKKRIINLYKNRYILHLKSHKIVNQLIKS